MLDNCSFSWRNRYENSNNTSNDDDDEETGNKNQSSSIANKVLDKNCIRNSTKLEQEKRTEEEEEEENWEKNDQSKPFLREISIRIKEKSFVAIVGNVGSGKSSLLNAILGNMELIQGSINMYVLYGLFFFPSFYFQLACLSVLMLGHVISGKNVTCFYYQTETIQN